MSIYIEIRNISLNNDYYVTENSIEISVFMFVSKSDIINSIRFIWILFNTLDEYTYLKVINSVFIDSMKV
jgi:hypothetical protein